jgi:hypothetical protein
VATRVIIAGALAAHPLGAAGYTWAFLQYVLGFRRLGFDTYYVEHIANDNHINHACRPAAFADSANARHFRDTMARYSLTDHAALLQWDGVEHVGLSHTEVERLARETALFVNISGRFHLASILGAARRRLYLDLDPGFTQIWQEQYGVDMNLRGHDLYVTVGLNLGAAGCPLPTCGLQWHTTLPPVVLSEWTTTQPAGPAYSTVADWRGYNPVEWRGVWYGQKSEEFLRVLDLPRRVDVPLELCLAIHPDEPDRARLLECGWRLVDPRTQVATLDSYRNYLFGSRGELTAVKNGYAVGRSGWFSDRSACYLAAARPVIIQDTGLAGHLPTGDGLLVFTDVATAAAAIDRVEADYARHAAAAAEFARHYLDSDRVIGHLVELSEL